MINMKRGIILSTIISLLLVFVFALFFIKPISNNSINTTSSFEQFEQEFINELQNSKIEYITINKNSNISTLKNMLQLKNNETTFQNTLSANGNIQLTAEHLKTFCNNNDYVFVEEDDCFKIRNQYSLKRLIVTGKVTNTYNAKNFITGYKDYNILSYNTIEETKQAYENLSSNPNLNVIVDMVISNANVSSFETNYNYSNYNTWGAEAMDLGYYNDYLATYGTTKQVAVAVFDSGINTSHTMFTNRFIKSNGYIVGTSYTTTTNTSTGYSFEDDDGHGTHVSGIICDLTPSNVKIIPIKVLDNNGDGYLSSVITGLEKVYNTYSSTYQVVCNNLSLGGEFTDPTKLADNTAAFDKVFTKLKNKNILSVVAAGNEGSDTSTFCPAACKDSAIVVSSIKNDTGSYTFDNVYSNSNFGETVDISAPGGKITSAYIGGKYTYAISSGTSMAAPHVAAAVALLCLDGTYYSGTTPTYSAEIVEYRLYNATIDLGTPNKDTHFGYGMLNLKNHTSNITYVATDTEVVYDGAYHNIGVSLDLNIDYTIKYGFSMDNCTITDITTNSAFKNATNGAMRVYFKVYSMNTVLTYGSANLNIKQADLKISIGNDTSTYGDTISLDNNNYTITEGTVYGSDKLNITLNTSATKYSYVNTYPITATWNNNNYNITFTNGTLTITQRPISIKLTEQSFVYGNTISLNANEYSVTSGSVANGDNLGLKLITNATSTSEIGSYSLTLNDYTNKNYNITATAGTLKITKRPINLTLLNQSSTYGEAISLNHNAYTIKSGSLVGSDNLGVTLSSNANNLKVGKYSITISSATNKNYNVTATNGVYSITKRNVQYNVENQEFTYGDNFTLAGDAYSLTAGSVLTGDNLNLSLSTNGTNSSSVGEYEITLHYNNPNYNVTSNIGTLTIIPRSINIEVENKTITYGDSLALDESSYTIVSGQVLPQDELHLTLTTQATNNSGIGSYEIVATSENENYIVTILNNAITINKRKIALNILQTGIYGSNIELNPLNYTIVEGNIVNNDDLGLLLSTTATSKSNIGSYDIIVDTTNANSNYDIEIKSAIYKILPKQITLFISNQESVYGDVVIIDNSKYFVDESSIVAGDELNIKLTTTATQFSNAGTYPITATWNNENYIIYSSTAEYKIHKRHLTVKLSNQSVSYSFNFDYDDNAYDIVDGEIIGDDDLKISAYSNANIFSFAGNYDLSAYSSNENYDITFIDAELEVQFSPTAAGVIIIPIVVIIGLIVLTVIIRIKIANKRERNLNRLRRM